MARGQTQGSRRCEGEQGKGVLGSECQALSGFDHHHTSAHRAYLVWAQEGSELLTLGAFKEEQGGAEQRKKKKKNRVDRVTQPLRKPKLVFAATTSLLPLTPACQVFALSAQETVF